MNVSCFMLVLFLGKKCGYGTRRPAFPSSCFSLPRVFPRVLVADTWSISKSRCVYIFLPVRFLNTIQYEFGFARCGPSRQRGGRFSPDDDSVTVRVLGRSTLRHCTFRALHSRYRTCPKRLPPTTVFGWILSIDLSVLTR